MSCGLVWGIGGGDGGLRGGGLERGGGGWECVWEV